MCVKLVAMKDAQMCCFRSCDCFYCGSIEKTYTEFWAIMWILLWSQGHSAVLSFTEIYVWLLWRNEQGREVMFKVSVWGYYTRVAVTEYQQSGSRLLAFKAWLTVCFSQMFSCMMLGAMRRWCWPQKLLFYSEWMCMSVVQFWDR